MHSNIMKCSFVGRISTPCRYLHLQSRLFRRSQEALKKKNAVMEEDVNDNHKKRKLRKEIVMPWQQTDVQPEFCDKDPVDHTLLHDRHIYSIDGSLMSGRLADAVPKRFTKLSKAIHCNSVMIRKPSLECIRLIAESQEDEVPVKVLLHGPNGGGKSMCLLHVLHYCLLKDMVIIYLPNPFLFVDEQEGSIQQSTWKATRLDQPALAKQWVDTFRAMNPTFVSSMMTSQEYKWGKRESTQQGKTFAQLIDQGCSRLDYTTDLVGVLLKEIRLNKNLNVLYAVEACNGLFGATTHEGVDRQNLGLVEMFSKLLKPEYSLSKGAYVFATSRSGHMFKRHPKLQHEHLEFRANTSLDMLFDQSSLSRLSDFTEVEVPEYNEDEFLTMLNFYKLKGWLARDISEDLVKQVRFVTNRNGNELHHVIRTL